MSLNNLCKYHPSHQISLFCKEDNCSLCEECFLESHASHSIIQIDLLEKAKRYSYHKILLRNKEFREVYNMTNFDDLMTSLRAESKKNIYIIKILFNKFIHRLSKRSNKFESKIAQIQHKSEDMLESVNKEEKYVNRLVDKNKQNRMDNCCSNKYSDEQINQLKNEIGLLQERKNKFISSMQEYIDTLKHTFVAKVGKHRFDSDVCDNNIKVENDTIVKQEKSNPKKKKKNGGSGETSTSSFALFLKDFCQEKKNNGTFDRSVSVFKQASVVWKTMDSETKSVYRNNAISGRANSSLSNKNNRAEINRKRAAERRRSIGKNNLKNSSKPKCNKSKVTSNDTKNPKQNNKKRKTLNSTKADASYADNNSLHISKKKLKLEKIKEEDIENLYNDIQLPLSNNDLKRAVSSDSIMDDETASINSLDIPNTNEIINSINESIKIPAKEEEQL